MNTVFILILIILKYSHYVIFNYFNKGILAVINNINNVRHEHEINHDPLYSTFSMSMAVCVLWQTRQTLFTEQTHHAADEIIVLSIPYFQSA